MQRRVARAMRAGGPEVIEVGLEDLRPLKAGEALVRVEAVGLNHAETLVRRGNYVVPLAFPWVTGGEGSGVIVDVGPESPMPVGIRVCWGAVIGSCADFVIAPTSMLVALPDGLSFEDGACLPVAGITAAGLTRVWPLAGAKAVVWGAAGAVGRMLVAMLADHGVAVIGIASGRRVEGVRAAGASYVIDRSAEDVREAVSAYTNGQGAAAVFDPIGRATFESSVQMLAARGCLINYGEMSGPAPTIDLQQLFPGSVFVTKYNGLRWVEDMHEFPALVSAGLALALKRPAVISAIAGRFPLEQASDAYRALESAPNGKVLVIPKH